jgi:thermitase
VSKTLSRQLQLILAALVGTALVLIFVSGASGQPGQEEIDESPRGIPYAMGELIVTYSSAPARSTGLVARQSGAQIERDIPAINVQLLSFPEIENERVQEVRERTLERMRQTLERNPAVESADYNYIRTPAWTPNDPRFGEQWGLKKIQAPQAWSNTRGRPATRIAILDSGIAPNHPDLESKVAARRDFTGNGSTTDRSGHGTHVAGIAAAVTNNGRGVAGACPNCTFLIGKIINDDGRATVADEVDGIVWAADRGARIINLSLGGAGQVAAEENAINYAWNQGAVVLAAAGNESSNTPQYPAGYAQAMGVAATDQNDRRARFSSYGDWVSVAAPGVDTLSTYPGGYRRLSGTSMATPHVAGVAGLMSSQGFGNAQIRNRLQNTARDLPFVRHGRIDASEATFRPYRRAVDNANTRRFQASNDWGMRSNHSQKWGPDYRLTRPANVRDNARFKVNIPRRGSYEVFARWPADPGYNSRTRFIIRTTNGWRARVINQRRNGGRWVRLGTFNMPAGDRWNVAVSRQSSAGGYVIADGVLVQETR